MFAVDQPEPVNKDIDVLNTVNLLCATKHGKSVA